MMSYINETDFVIENKELVYPEIITDGLQLYYDAKGKRDTDYHRDTMLDMSGNKNHGKLHNFAYEKHSGYKDGLVFDYIDDKLVRPALNLKPDDFTFMLNGNIISFSPDGTVKRIQDGEVIESKGFNMLYDMEGTSSNGLDVTYNYNHAEARWTGGNTNTFLYSTSKYNYKDKHKYYISYNAKPDGNVRLRIYANERYLDGDILNPIINEYNFRSGIVEAESQYSNPFNVRLFFGSDSVIGTKIDIKDLTMIDLTESFGAGNEPTKEQMDEIIQRFGFIPNAQDLIDRIEYKGNDLGDMENIIDGLYKTEVLSGEEIYTDKADDSVVHVEIDGKSVGGGSGKNMVQTNFVMGHVSLETEYNTNRAYSVDNFTIKLNNTYTLSVTGKAEFEYSYQISANLVHPYNGIFQGWYTINSSKTFTSSADGVLAVMVRKADSTDFTLAEISDIKIQLEEGSVATEYEPPAPTPDYPIEIHSLNDFDVVSSVGKENLILESNYIPFTQGVEETYNGHLCTKIASNTSANYSKANINFSEESVVGSWYTYSVLVAYQGEKPDSIMLYLNGFHGYTIAEGFDSLVEGVFGRIYITSKATNNSTSSRPHLHIRGGDGHVYFTKWKIEKSDKPTDWTPAPEDIVENDNHPSIDKINLLLDEPLRSVGDVKDRLFRDSDGLWKVERNVGEHIADENTIVSAGNQAAGFIHFDTLANYNISNIKHSHSSFKSTNLNNIVKGNFSLSTSKNKYAIGYPTSNTVQGLKDWIADEKRKGTPVTFMYELESSQIEFLSDELQDKLNNLRSFEDSNYVYTVLPNESNTLSDKLKPTLHAKFLYNNWYKEDRVINNLMIYNRALTNEEMLQNYKTIKRRWGM